VGGYGSNKNSNHGNLMQNIMGVGDGGRGEEGMYPPPPPPKKKNWEKYFSGNY